MSAVVTYRDRIRARRRRSWLIPTGLVSLGVGLRYALLGIGDSWLHWLPGLLLLAGLGTLFASLLFNRCPACHGLWSLYLPVSPWARRMVQVADYCPWCGVSLDSGPPAD